MDSAGSNGLQGTTIRIAAVLSSLAISDREPPDPKLGVEYCDALLAERDALRNALLCGARLKAVLNPPRRFAQAMLPGRLAEREHELWMEFHEQNSWHYSKGRDKANRRHPLMLPFQELDQVQQQKDHKASLAYPELAKLAGYKIVFA